MKTTAISFAVMMMSALTFGQTKPSYQTDNEQSSASIYNYIREHINCPAGNLTCFRPGTEVIAFVVTSAGELKDFRVVSSISQELDEAMIEVLKETSGNWEPGTVKGEATEMEHEVAMAFIPANFDPVMEATRYLTKGNALIYKNPKRALRYLNEAFRLLPCNESVLVARSTCKAQLGDTLGAVEDANRILSLNSQKDHQNDETETLVLAKGNSPFTK